VETHVDQKYGQLLSISQELRLIYALGRGIGRNLINAN